MGAAANAGAKAKIGQCSLRVAADRFVPRIRAIALDHGDGIGKLGRR